MGRGNLTSNVPNDRNAQLQLVTDLPDADLVVGVAGEEGLPVGGPGHREALRRVAVASHLKEEMVF